MSNNPFAGWTEARVREHNRQLEVKRLQKLKSDLGDVRLLTKTSEYYPTKITPAMMEGLFEGESKLLPSERLVITKDIVSGSKIHMDEIPQKYAIQPYLDATPYFDLNKYERETKSFSVPLTIIGAKRMTQADKGLHRPCIRAYMEFRNKLVDLVGKHPTPDLLNFRCWIPMPDSWSKKKKARMDGQPHRQKPDVDNAQKVLLDSILEGDDKGVWGSEFQFKFWCRQGHQRIDIELVYLKMK